MIRGIRYFVTVSLLRCAACSMCHDAQLRSPGHAGLLGNYLTENQISYCLDVSSLRLCQITLRQLGISNNTCLMKEPAFSMSRVLRGWANWSREVNLAPPCSSSHWGNRMTFISSDGLVLWDSCWAFHQEQIIGHLSFWQSLCLGSSDVLLTSWHQKIRYFRN